MGNKLKSNVLDEEAIVLVLKSNVLDEYSYGGRALHVHFY